MLSMVSTQSSSVLSAQSPVDTRTVSTSQWGFHWEQHAGQWSSEWRPVIGDHCHYYLQVASFTRAFLISFSLTLTHPVPVLWPPGSSLSSLTSHSPSLSSLTSHSPPLSPSSPHRISVTSKSNLIKPPVLHSLHINTNHGPQYPHVKYCWWTLNSKVSTAN